MTHPAPPPLPRPPAAGRSRATRWKHTETRFGATVEVFGAGHPATARVRVEDLTSFAFIDLTPAKALELAMAVHDVCGQPRPVLPDPPGDPASATPPPPAAPTAPRQAR